MKLARNLDVVSASLLAGFVIALACGGIELNHLFGLPAHVLLVHAPVVLLPLVTLCTVLVFARSKWRAQFGPYLAAVAVVVLGFTMMAKAAGDPLEHQEEARINVEYGSNTPSARAQHERIEEHAEAGDKLGSMDAVFTFFLVGFVVAERQMRRKNSSAVESRSYIAISAVFVTVLALFTLTSVVRVGHLGSKAVWEQRVLDQPQSATDQ